MWDIQKSYFALLKLCSNYQHFSVMLKEKFYLKFLTQNLCILMSTFACLNSIWISLIKLQLISYFIWTYEYNVNTNLCFIWLCRCGEILFDIIHPVAIHQKIWKQIRTFCFVVKFILPFASKMLYVINFNSVENCYFPMFYNKNFVFFGLKRIFN